MGLKALHQQRPMRTQNEETLSNETGGWGGAELSVPDRVQEEAGEEGWMGCCLGILPDVEPRTLPGKNGKSPTLRLIPCSLLLFLPRW